MGTSVRLSRSVAVLTLALAMVLTSVSAAFAADPANVMQTIKDVKFNNSSHGFVLEDTGVDSTAYWGIVNSQRTPPSGTGKSLWVAGTLIGGAPSSHYPRYPEDTNGRAIAQLDVLEEYYSSQFSFTYIYPSRGAADETAFNVYYGSTGAKQPGVTTAWTTLTYPLETAEFSRASVPVVFRFNDQVEFGGSTGGDPLGPEIDSFVVKGYKYGTVASATIQKVAGDGIPVASASSLKSVYETQSNVRLTGSDSGAFAVQWDPPRRAFDDYTPDDRDIAYRVWRRPSGGSWTELTSATERVSGTKIQDYVATGGPYDYAVQPWDESPGQGRGKFITKQLSIPSPSSGGGSITKIEYQVDGGSVVTHAGSYYDLNQLTPKNGTYTVKFRVQDNEGNWSDYKTISFKVLAKTYFTGLSGNKVPSYGAASYVSGTLKTGYTGISGHLVALQRLSNRTSGSWVTVATKRTSSTGYVKFDIPASSSGYNYTKTVYRMAYSGAAQYAAAPPSSSRTIHPKASLGKPWKSVKTVRAKKTYTWYASIKPRHSAGTKPVKLQFERYKSGKWRAYKTVSATAYNYTSSGVSYSRVKVKYKLPYKGTWRVRAVHSDTGHATSYSSWYKFKVK